MYYSAGHAILVLLLLFFLFRIDRLSLFNLLPREYVSLYIIYNLRLLL